ncbi:hypothetical protein PPYR_14177 [Photinus pyralis]|uniref:Uncharacterized protein n=1 Tax=Photinus pyralis TaxID=7054 RepID=A0A5N4A4J6_PHOPY|nr:hypothetical protein PPYR_14177 [Photinus pyralis]
MVTSRDRSIRPPDVRLSRRSESRSSLSVSYERLHLAEEFIYADSNGAVELILEGLIADPDEASLKINQED